MFALLLVHHSDSDLKFFLNIDFQDEDNKSNKSANGIKLKFHIDFALQ